MANCIIFLKSLLTRSDANNTLSAEVYNGIKWLPNEEDFYWQVSANKTCGLSKEAQDELKILLEDVARNLPNPIKKELMQVCTCSTTGRVLYFLTGSKMRLVGTAVAVGLAYLAIKYVVRHGKKIRKEEREMCEMKLAELKRQLGINLNEEVNELKGTLVHAEDLKGAVAGLAKQKDLDKLQDRVDTINSGVEGEQLQQSPKVIAVDMEEGVTDDQEDVTAEFDGDSNGSIISEWIELDEELWKEAK
ncbi:hypothetical protein BU16DRAFT_533791 [Lophium mytilinum]|uniref:Uncharacterized protein n=1 Tax=Lophium mytilinum TaxID=390894 RepID=A0A6A6R949_9PEZI|nr:hypothetical protein BU16DRAFT_533791 [Lophium mytilinum]